MANRKIVLLAVILVITAILRFYNLMHDEPYFFNPDERNMAAAITQLHLPQNIYDIPKCILNEFSPTLYPKPYTLNPNICNLNPRFFAYGQFPLYLAFSNDQIIKPIYYLFSKEPITHNQPASPAGGQLTTTFPSAIFWLRFWSALASTLTVLFVFLISRHLFTFHISLITMLFTVFTPGLIQSAHFGTTESLLTFFFMVTIYFSIKMLHKNKKGVSLKYLILISLTIGMAFGAKLTGLFCLFPVFVSYLIQVFQLIKSKISKLKKFIGLIDYLFIGVIFVLFTAVFCVFFSPYNLIDQKEFLGSVFGYEQDVATGRYEAFYTRQFTNTVPVLFQMQKVFPYALGWPIFIFGTAGFMLMTATLLSHLIIKAFRSIQNKVLSIKRNKRIKNIINPEFLILTASFIFYLLPNAFLFAKWTRFMTPIFPFFAIFAGYLLNVILGIRQLAETPESKEIDSGHPPALNCKANRAGARMTNWIFGLLVFIGLLPGAAFFSIYTRPDSRVQASKWIYENIPDRSYILSETANVIDIPLGLPNYHPSDNKPIPNYKVISFDFYHLDENPAIFETLPSHLEKADYILIPSRRIFANHMNQSKKYPLTTKYYQLLFSGRLGFEKVAEISSYPTLTIPYLSYKLKPKTYNLIFPDEKAEETSTVFDHPVIRIYKKTLPFYEEQYKRMMGN